MTNRNPRQPASATPRRAEARAPRSRSESATVDYGALQHAIGYLVHLAELANMQGFSRAFAETGVTPARLTALELIACNPGIKPTALATAMAVERSNLVSVIRYLSERGWVAASEGSNRREKSLSATAAGHAAIADLRVRLRAHDNALAAGCSAAERAQLTQLLARLVKAAPAAPPAGDSLPRARSA